MSTPLRIWLTGASSGIGLELAHQLAAAGHQLALSARRAEPLQQLAEQYPGQLLVLPADLTDAASLQRAAHEIDAHWGALDWVILNAGCCEYVEVDEFDPALFRRVMDTNLHGNVECIAAALPLLRRGHQPRLAAVGSSVTFCPLPRAEAYGASKAALRYLLQSLELDLAQWGIGVSLISPGFVDTPMTAVNDFPMPMRIDGQSAARRIIRGLERGQREIRFPWLFTLFLRLLGNLPNGLRFALTRGLARPASNKESS